MTGRSTSDNGHAAADDRQFAQVLRVVRKRVGVTQEGLAERMGYSVSHIRKLEGGDRDPTDEVVGRAIAALDLREEEAAALRQAQQRDSETAAPLPSSNEPLPPSVTAIVRWIVGMAEVKLSIGRGWVYGVLSLLSVLAIVLICWATLQTVVTARALLSPQPTPREVSAAIVPGGVWLSPLNHAHVGNTIVFAARAYPTRPTDPKIGYVNFTVSWNGRPGPWLVACRVTKPTVVGGMTDVYRCTWHPGRSKEHVPAGLLNISFDVYDQAGNRNMSPNGTHVLTYHPHKAH